MPKREVWLSSANGHAIGLDGGGGLRVREGFLFCGGGAKALGEGGARLNSYAVCLVYLGSFYCLALFSLVIDLEREIRLLRRSSTTLGWVSLSTNK